MDAIASGVHALPAKPGNMYDAAPMSAAPPFPFNRSVHDDTPGPLYPSNIFDSGYPHPPAEAPTPKEKAAQAKESARHGERFKSYVAASHLRGRLGESSHGIRNPEDGFEEETIEASRMWSRTRAVRDQSIGWSRICCMATHQAHPNDPRRKRIRFRRRRA